MTDAQRQEVVTLAKRAEKELSPADYCALCYALGKTEGKSMAHFAALHGISRQAFCLKVKTWEDVFGVPVAPEILVKRQAAQAERKKRDAFINRYKPQQSAP